MPRHAHAHPSRPTQRTEFLRRLVEIAGLTTAFEGVDVISLYQQSMLTSHFLSEGRLATAIGKAIAEDKASSR